MHLTPTRPRLTLMYIQTPNQGDPLPGVRGPYSLGWATLDVHLRVNRSLVGSSAGPPRLTRHRLSVGPTSSRLPAGARLATARMAATVQPSFQSSVGPRPTSHITGPPTGPDGPSGGGPHSSTRWQAPRAASSPRRRGSQYSTVRYKGPESRISYKDQRQGQATCRGLSSLQDIAAVGGCSIASAQYKVSFVHAAFGL